jgi:hypothetical protein
MGKKRGYDYTLVIATVVILLAIGVISLYSIGYYHDAANEDPGWSGSQEFASYLEMMNTLASPMVVALLIVLGLCIPKRVVPRRELKRISAFILGATALVYVLRGISAGLGLLLIIAIAVQAASLSLTIMKRGRLVYEKEGYLVQLGSAMLHLGVIVLIFDIAVLREHALHISIFWVSTILLLLGMFFSFYGRTDLSGWLTAIKR